VVNVSEGRRTNLVAELGEAAGTCLLDIHSDPFHNRSVLTLGGPDEALHEAVRAVAKATVARLDLSKHEGVHPRIGVLDVVPWVALRGWPLQAAPLGPAIAARDDFARWANATLGLPCFLYGPERTLPQVRRGAWISLLPDVGTNHPHPTAGAVAVGARPPLVAYNLWLSGHLALAQTIAASLRSPAIQALGLQVGSSVQVSCNLLDPAAVHPGTVYDAVATQAAITRAELVGLVPALVLESIPEGRWPELGLSPSQTIEARLEVAGLDRGR
jgi:glutamate formiminotransferase/glutamate formiminotransferase/formiminotetrahydrofolate cyclodeaminase